MKNSSIGLFYSYCHADEGYRDNMEKFLALLRKDGLLTEWHDRKMVAGKNINEQIKEQMLRSEIVAFLVSADFLASDACKKEWDMAKSLAMNSDKRLVSIILRKCPWTDFDDMGDYLALPKDGQPICKWENEDAYWNYVYSGFKSLIKDIESSYKLKKKI